MVQPYVPGWFVCAMCDRARCVESSGTRSSLLSGHKRQFEESNIPKDWESSDDDSDSVASDDDSSMYSSGDLDDEDDLKPASKGIEELKQQCIDSINNKLAAFPASLRYALIERVRNAVVGEIFYWCQGLCDYYTKSLMSGNTFEGVNRSKRAVL